MTSDNTDYPSPLIENLMYAAAMCVAQGKADDAILLYDKVVGQMQDYGLAYYERGRARLQVGDLRGSAEDLKRALQLSPELEKQITGQFHADTSTSTCG